MIVIVADNVPKELFSDNKKYGKELIVWEIKDEYKSIPTIMKNVNKLLGQFGEEL